MKREGKLSVGREEERSGKGGQGGVYKSTIIRSFPVETNQMSQSPMYIYIIFLPYHFVIIL